MFNQTILISDLRRDEGVEYKPYRDTVGKTSIGVGRNLTDIGVSDDEINLMLSNDIKRATTSLDQYLPWWANLDDVRQGALINLCFNMGITSLMGFKNMLAFLQGGQYAQSASALLDSTYAKQVGARAQRIANVIKTGVHA